MIRSMTGYGSATHSGELGDFSVEVKSLNNRFLDLTVKLPKELNFLEPEMREEVKRHLRRGKVELFLRWTPAAGTPPLYEINADLLRHYAGQVRAAIGADQANAPMDVGALLALPGVVNPTRAAAEQETLRESALGATKAAVQALDKAREHEGKSLMLAITQHLEVLESFRDEVMTLKDELLEEYRNRLRERIDTLSKTIGTAVDPARMETEMMFFVDKSDITEELVRLESHLATLRQQAQPEFAGAVGKSMDFLVQELLREVNTIGNKARGLPVASRIVKMKSEIEKIREQVQNIE